MYRALPNPTQAVFKSWRLRPWKRGVFIMGPHLGLRKPSEMFSVRFECTFMCVSRERVRSFNQLLQGILFQNESKNLSFGPFSRGEEIERGSWPQMLLSRLSSPRVMMGEPCRPHLSSGHPCAPYCVAPGICGSSLISNNLPAEVFFDPPSLS